MFEIIRKSKECDYKSKGNVCLLVDWVCTLSLEEEEESALKVKGTS